MADQERNVDRLLWALQERAKELNCLYAVEELLLDPEVPIETVLESVIKVIPPGWQYPEICQAKITFNGRTFTTPFFEDTPWFQFADIVVQDAAVGRISVYYRKEMPQADVGPFLKEEARLIATIADRLGHFIQYQHLRRVHHEWQAAKQDMSVRGKEEWRIILDLLRRTDQNLYRRVTRKMFVRLCSGGIREALQLQDRLGGERDGNAPTDENIPTRKYSVDLAAQYGSEIFDIAGTYFSDAEILSSIQKWMQEDKSSFLVTALESFGTTLSDIADALRRFHRLKVEGVELSPITDKEVRVALIRRFFTDQLEYINVAKEYIEVSDFYDLLQRIISPAGSHGKLGGKSAGLYLASRIVKRAAAEHDVLKNVRAPRTWHITSDALLSFVTHNNLEELVEHKYREIDEIRAEYQQIVQVFKHSTFPPEIVAGLSVALDDFENRPLIVRSSSLLEDRFGSAFSGKYKSLFLANQGSKQQRMEALMDAVAEVYSSTFGPDPIQYRAERGLLDFREEMGIMIQEVVGTRVGDYFLPAFAGVAFSNNEFRWSPRIRREDGLIRLVPGLGTRAVDRLSDDYPILLAPGQPGLRVNVSPEDVMRYSPNRLDVINLATNSFETVEARKFFRRYGDELPWTNQTVSLCRDHQILVPTGLYTDLSREDFVVTFEGMITRSPFVKQVQLILKILQDKLGTPVDIEFAHDGSDFHLLQCRPQSYSQDAGPSPIPQDIPSRDTVFTARRFVSNGKIPDLTHIVYVCPRRYSEVADLSTLQAIGRAIGELNKTLPKRQFALLGPGRWGSRGDIKLGVSVTYSDINNTALLVEIARQSGNYVPDLSFGTHFFQDLVESSIRYLPLYPDDPKVLFNEHFLTSARNILPEIAPEFAFLADTVRVIDVPSATGGRILRVLMNADLDEAIGFLTRPAAAGETRNDARAHVSEQPTEEHWRWRVQMAEKIAEHLDPERFGVKALYLFGSAKNATAGPGSDLDLLIHVDGTDAQQEALRQWLEGWSLCLAEINYLRTGYRTEKLLDVHWITDEDVAARSTFAAKIGAVTDAARPLLLRRQRETV